MDDFLFDPWSADGADTGSPSTETEENAAAEETAAAEEDVTTDQDAIVEKGDATDEHGTAPDTKSPRRWTVRSGPTEAPRNPVSSSAAPFHSIPDHPRLPGEDQPSLLAKRLRAMAVPRIEETATRLRAARHRTLLDDRLDHSEPVLRFRLIPWEGPFDEAPTVAGSVFELIVAEPDVVIARRWLHPVAEAPETEVRVHAEKLDEAWIDRQLVAFVEKSLQRG